MYVGRYCAAGKAGFGRSDFYWLCKAGFAIVRPLYGASLPNLGGFVPRLTGCCMRVLPFHLRFSMRTSCIVLWLGAVSGCMTGPFSGVAKWRPDLRREWKEDAVFGPTLHQQVEDLQKLRNTAETLSPTEQETWSQRLVELAQSNASPVLMEALVRTLGVLPTETAATALRTAVKHAEPDVRSAACLAWSERGGTEAADQLATVAGADTNQDVRLTALRELSRFPGKKTVTTLGVALDDRSPAVQWRAMQSLKVVTGLDYGDNVPAWREFVSGGNPGAERRPSVAERVSDLFRF